MGRSEENYYNVFKKITARLQEKEIVDLRVGDVITATQEIVDIGYDKGKYGRATVKLWERLIKAFLKWTWGMSISKKLLKGGKNIITKDIIPQQDFENTLK